MKGQPDIRGMEDIKLYVSDIVGKIVDKVYETTMVCIAVENDGYWVKNRDNSGYMTVLPQNVYKVPTIPFYHSAWLYKGEYIKPEVAELKNAIERQYGKINRTKGMIACPSDALPVDIRMLEETFQLMGMFKCKLVNKTALPAINGITDYVAISSSERLIILEVYRNGEVAENKYFEKSVFDMEELVNDINTVCYGTNTDVYLFDSTNELTALSELGRIVSGNEVMDMLDSASKILFNVQEQKPQQKPQQRPQQQRQNNRQNQGQQGMNPYQNQQNNGNYANNQYSQGDWNNEQLQFNRQDNWNGNQGQDSWNDNSVNTEQFRRPTKDEWANSNKNNSAGAANRNVSHGNQLQIGMNNQQNNINQPLPNGQMNNRQTIQGQNQMNNRQTMQGQNGQMNSRQPMQGQNVQMNNRQPMQGQNQMMNNGAQAMPNQNIRRNIQPNQKQLGNNNGQQKQGGMSGTRQQNSAINQQLRRNQSSMNNVQMQQEMNNRQSNQANMNNYNQQANWSNNNQMNSNWSNNDEQY